MAKEENYYVKFNGGLGNQMFQWAFARSLGFAKEKKILFDMSFFSKRYARPFELDIFGINPPKVTNIFTKLKLAFLWKFRKKMNKKSFGGITLYSEPHVEFDQGLFELEPNTYIEGFFQSQIYFGLIKDFISADFRFKNPPSGINKEFADKIANCNSVSLHIRRGDYVQKKRYQDMFAHCSLDYYRHAVDYIAEHCQNPTIFVFSDDINWARENLKLPYECVYVSHNSGKNSYEDMRLMSLCDHNIIANSSFSWWGAWLNKNPYKIVIAPQWWYSDKTIVQTDIIPQEWVRLEN